MAAASPMLAILCLCVGCLLRSASASSSSSSAAANSTTPFDVHSECPHLLSLSSLRASPPANGTLRVLVPWKVGFDQFVKFRRESCIIDGFSVQVFLSALRYIQDPPRYQFVLYGAGQETPVYSDMIDMVQNETADAVVADLTITSDRWRKVDFTVPYLASFLVMVTPFRYGSGENWFDLLKPFSWQLWTALLGFFLITGIELYVLENKNPEFHKTVKAIEGRDQGSSHGGSSQGLIARPCSLAEAPPTGGEFPDQASENTQTASLQEGRNNLPLANDVIPSHAAGPDPALFNHVQASRKRRITNAYWFTSLCVFQSQQESVRTHLGRIVTVMWLFMALIFNQSYTASLASLLSAQTIFPTIPSFQALLNNINISVGYQAGSFMDDYMKTLNLQAHESKAYSSEIQYAQALREGNLKSDGVGAVLDELPYIQILLNFECDLTDNFPDSSQLPSFGGFGFAFRKGDPFIDRFSKAILQMGEDGTLETLKNGWNIGNAGSSECSSGGQPSHLRLRSALGLLCIIIFVYVVCFVLRLFRKAMKSQGKIYIVHPLKWILQSYPHRRETSLSRGSNGVYAESEHDQVSE